MITFTVNEEGVTGKDTWSVTEIGVNGKVQQVQPISKCMDFYPIYSIPETSVTEVCIMPSLSDRHRLMNRPRTFQGFVEFFTWPRPWKGPFKTQGLSGTLTDCTNPDLHFLSFHHVTNKQTPPKKQRLPESTHIFVDVSGVDLGITAGDVGLADAAWQRHSVGVVGHPGRGGHPVRGVLNATAMQLHRHRNKNDQLTDIEPHPLSKWSLQPIVDRHWTPPTIKIQFITYHWQTLNPTHYQNSVYNLSLTDTEPHPLSKFSL